jgi:hypothetical protein
MSLISTAGQEAPSEITRLTVALDCGDIKCSDFKNPRAGHNRNHVLPKGYVATGSELRGEKRCGLKPLLATSQSRAYVRS